MSDPLPSPPGESPWSETAWGLLAVALPMATAWVAFTLWPNASTYPPAEPVADNCRLAFLQIGLLAGLRTRRSAFILAGPPVGLLVGHLHSYLELVSGGHLDGATLLMLVLFWGSVLGCLWGSFQKYLQGPLVLGGMIVAAEALGHFGCGWLKGRYFLERGPLLDASWIALGVRHVPASIVLVWLAARWRRSEIPVNLSPPVSLESG